MSKARHSRLVVTPAVVQAKARHSRLAVTNVAEKATARHSTLKVSLSGALPHARHSRLAVTGGAGAGVVRKILTASGWLPLGIDQTTPTFPVWGPYGELGAYKPDAATSGVPDSATLNVVTGDTVYTTSGTATNPILHFRQDYRGKVTIQGSYHTFKECFFRGPVAEPPVGGGGLLQCNTGTVRGILVEDSTFRPQTPNDMLDAIYGHHYTVRRCDVSATVDGFGVNSSNITDYDTHIEANYVHGFAYRTSRTQSDGHTHNDGTQVYAGSNIWIVGNNYQCFTDTDPAVSNLTNVYASTGNQNTGQVVLVQPNSGAIGGVHVLDNWMDGATEGGIVHATEVNGNQNTGLEVKRNRVGRNQHAVGGVKYTVRIQTVVDLAPGGVPETGVDANVFEDNGTPVTVVRY